MADRMPPRRKDPAQYDDEFAPLSDNEALRRRVERQLNKRREFLIDLGAFVVVNAGLMIAFWTAGMFWIAGVIALGWGAGLAGHGIDTYYQTGRRAANRLARMHQAFRDAYGPDWYETATPQQLQIIRNRVDEPINKRKELTMHAAVYACIIPLLWLVYFSVGFTSVPWPLIAMVGWGLGLAGHAASVLSHGRQENEVEREMERQRRIIEMANGTGEKPKNDFRTNRDLVTDDGELIEPDEEQDARAMRQRGR